MEIQNRDRVAPAFPYEAMTLERRRQILPERNVCSLYPAENGSEVFGTGNGTQRAEMTGDPYEEKISFTHEMLYEPKWKNAPEPPDLTPVMPEVRRLLREGKFVEAADLVEKRQLEAGFGSKMRHVGTIDCGDIVDPPMPPFPHTAFWLKLQSGKAQRTFDYLRWLDLLSGVLTTQWQTEEGAFCRELFSSFRDPVVVMRLRAPKGKLNLRLDFVKPDDDARAPFGAKMFAGNTSELETHDDLIALKWAYIPEYGQKGYVSVVRLIREGGSSEASGNGIRISGADQLTVIAQTVKFEDDFTFACAEPVIAAVRAYQPDVDALIRANREYLGGRMKLSRLRLGKPEDFALSSEELLRRTHSEVEFDGTLLDKLYDMGRFFQITDTGELPPLYGQHNINTNLQVCAGCNTGLLTEMDVYFRYYETKFDDFRTNARKLFGARGLLCSIHCDYDSGLFYHFSKTYPHYCWTGCLGWIYNEFWNDYLVTGDRTFLRDRIVPALKEIALFFEDYACDRGPDGRVIFYPSFSPENPTPNYAVNGVYSTSINSVMDIMICREVLDNLIEACTELNIEQENIPHWKAQEATLPRYLLDEEGGLKEWAWPTVKENYDHRHVSHHYEVWPGHRVTWEEEPELARAIQISNRKRAHQNDSAHGIIHRLFTAIRLKDMPETVQNLYHLMNHGYVTRALQTRHNPYQHHMPDLQGAMPAILLEMCVYSKPGVVEFLPAMPASLDRGGIDGVWLYTFAKLERMDWNPKGLKATLTSRREQTLTLRCRRPGARFRVNGQSLPTQGNFVTCPIRPEETLEVEIEF